MSRLLGKRALIITTSHSVLAAPGETEGPETGVMASEFTHPYYTFIDNGMMVDMASIQGGLIPIDPQTLGYPVSTPEDRALPQRFDRSSQGAQLARHCMMLISVSTTLCSFLEVGVRPMTWRSHRSWPPRSARPITASARR